MKTFAPTAALQLTKAATLLGFSLLVLSSIGRADPVTPADLAGTGWEGHFTVRGLEPSIRIGFLSHFSANQVLYFHKITSSGPVSEGLDVVDTTCDFTPRALSLMPQNSNPVAQISVYSCAASAQEEARLENLTGRPVKATIQVTGLNLTRNGGKNSLEIVAEILGNTVTYKLEQQSDLSPSVFEDQDALRSWVMGP